MTVPISHQVMPGVARRQPGRAALLLGLAFAGLLWILYIPYLKLYVPNGFDIAALADGLLLAPDAHWEGWFTRGYSDFWNLYPEWNESSSRTAFTRPAFQFVIYLAHFALDKDWASYNVISCFAAAGVAALAFQIGQTALRASHRTSLARCVASRAFAAGLDLLAGGSRVRYRTARHCLRSRRLPCSCRAARHSLSHVAVSGALDQRKRRVGPSRSGHNHYAAPQA